MPATINPYSAPRGLNAEETRAQCVIGDVQAILEYDLAAEDLATWETSRFSFFRSVAGLLWALMVIIAILVVTVVLVFSLIPAAVKPIIGAMVSVPLIGSAIMIPMTFRRQLHSYLVAKYRTERRGATGFRRVVCDAVGVVSYGSLSSTSVPWDGVMRIVTSDGAIHVELTSGGAIIIPSHVFATEQDFDRLLRLLHSLSGASVARAA